MQIRDIAENPKVKMLYLHKKSVKITYLIISIKKILGHIKAECFNRALIVPAQVKKPQNIRFFFLRGP